MYELGYCSLLLLCERKLMTFTEDNIWYECNVFSRSSSISFTPTYCACYIRHFILIHSTLNKIVCILRNQLTKDNWACKQYSKTTKPQEVSNSFVLDQDHRIDCHCYLPFCFNSLIHENMFYSFE